MATQQSIEKSIVLTEEMKKVLVNNLNEWYSELDFEEFNGVVSNIGNTAIDSMDPLYAVQLLLSPAGSKYHQDDADTQVEMISSIFKKKVKRMVIIYSILSSKSPNIDKILEKIVDLVDEDLDIAILRSAPYLVISFPEKTKFIKQLVINSCKDFNWGESKHCYLLLHKTFIYHLFTETTDFMIDLLENGKIYTNRGAGLRKLILEWYKSVRDEALIWADAKNYKTEIKLLQEKISKITDEHGLVSSELSATRERSDKIKTGFENRIEQLKEIQRKFHNLELEYACLQNENVDLKRDVEKYKKAAEAEKPFDTMIDEICEKIKSIGSKENRSNAFAKLVQKVLETTEYS